MGAAAVERAPIVPTSLTTREAAVYIGMSVSFVEHSDIPRVKLGKAVRYLRADLDAYLLQRRDLDV